MDDDDGFRLREVLKENDSDPSPKWLALMLLLCKKGNFPVVGEGCTYIQKKKTIFTLPTIFNKFNYSNSNK